MSEYGDVVSAKTNKRLRGFVDYDGYIAYKLKCEDGCKRQVTAHRLVVLSFLGTEGRKKQIRHKDGSRMNCHYSNLIWGTARENRKDTVAHGTSPTRGERNPKAKLTEQDVKDIRRMHRDIKEGRLDMKVHELAAKYGLHIATICSIASKKLWRHVA
ncbi:MAG: HNH endonuclease [Octadecabacter sp.]|nr:HNH endonuclease [Octadecabacter sp.]